MTKNIPKIYPFIAPKDVALVRSLFDRLTITTQLACTGVLGEGSILSFQVTILNWELFNPRRDVTNASWLRFEHSFFEHPDFYDFTLEERATWIYMLCQASKSKARPQTAGSFTANPLHYHRVTGSPEEVFHRVVRKLKLLRIIETRTLRGRYADVTPAYPTNVTNERDETNVTNETVPEGSKKLPSEPLTSGVWNAYSDAFKKRYGATPVRNATVNGQLSRFVKRLGAEEAPRVAVFYISHSNGYYLREMHSVGAMLKDAEKLRTEWVTGNTVTHASIRAAEQTSVVEDQVRRIVSGDL